MHSNVSLSPSKLHLRRQDTASPQRDLSPPRRRNEASKGTDGPNGDISPPRRRRVHEDIRSPVTKGKEDDDLSPPRQRRRNFEADLSPPRRKNRSQHLDSTHASDLSPPRRSRKGSDKQSSPSRVSRQRLTEIDSAPDISPPRKSKQDLSVPSASKVQPPKRGLVSGQDTSKEIAKTKKEELLRSLSL